MNKAFLLFLSTMLFMACSKDDANSGDSTTGEETMADDAMGNNDDDSNSETVTYDITPLLEKFVGTGLTFEVDGDQVIFTTQDLPDHTSPYWPENHELYEEYSGSNPDWRQNPNTIGEQNIVFTINLNPTEAENKEATPMGPIGLARNGIVFFNQYAAGGEPLTNEINSFDQWLGHPANTTYHYHIEPTWLTEQFGADAFLGILADGFPVYGPMENGVAVTNADLDEYHGHTHATEEFPDGIFHYHITSEDPYLNGNGFFGTPGNITR